MSQALIERILGKVLLDSSFRDALLAIPEQALAGFPLTRNAKEYIRRMDAETLDELSMLFGLHNRLWRRNPSPQLRSAKKLYHQEPVG